MLSRCTRPTTALPRSSRGIASRSRMASGPVRWFTPMTTIDMCRSAYALTFGTRPTLLVVAEDLQLDGEVDLAHHHGGRHGEQDRGEVEDARDPGGNQAVGGLLRGTGRRGDDADRHVTTPDDVVQVGERAHLDAADDRADLAVVDVDHPGDREAAIPEPPVAGEGLAEVARTNDDDRPVVIEAELAAHLVDEVLDVVAHAT